MRVLLINPPTQKREVWIREGRCQQWDIWGAAFPPYSLAMIARQLTNSNIENTIVDPGPAKQSLTEVITECQNYQPDIVCVTSASPTIENDLGWFCGMLKESLNLKAIIAIGIHVSALPNDTLVKFSSIDYVIIGEVEDSARDLICHLNEGINNLDDIPGIAYRNNSGEIVVTSKRDFQPDLDTLGHPDWSSINFQHYRMPILNKPYSMVNFSRGCPYSCSYCATHTYNGKKLRNRSVDSLINEINYNLEFGITDFLFWTELLTIDRRHLTKFLEKLIQENLHKNIRWVCNSRADSADPELFRLMKKSGCWQIAFGFEFGNDEILQKAKKGGRASVEQNKLAAQIADEAGLCVDGHFILGYPGETEQTMQETINLACSMPLTFANFYACVPFPGTPLYIEAAEKGWINFDASHQYNQDHATLKGDGLLDTEIVQEYISKAYKRFYLRPTTIKRGLRIPKSLFEFGNLAKLGFGFYKDIALSAR